MIKVIAVHKLGVVRDKLINEPIIIGRKGEIIAIESIPIEIDINGKMSGDNLK